jgi:hypothetical protein
MPETMQEQEKLVLTETIGSVLWFVMDGCWMMNQALLAKAMIGPTAAINLLVFRYTRRSFAHIAVVAAMNSWLAMNVLWMLGDLDKDPRYIAVARMMFMFGIGLLAMAVGRSGMQAGNLTRVLSHFRRLRI